MDLKAKPEYQKALDTRPTRKMKDSIAYNPSLYPSHYPRQHATGHHDNRERNGKSIDPNARAVRNRRAMGVAADIPVAKARIPLRGEANLMPHSRPAIPKPDTQTTKAKLREEDDSDDVFSINTPNSKLGTKASEEEIGCQRGNHRAHATAIAAPHRRVRARDNLTDIFERMRVKRQIPNTRPGSDVSMSMAAFEHYMEVVISSARAREALTSFGEREAAECGDEEGSEDGRVRADELYRLVIQKLVEVLVAEAEIVGRSCWVGG